MEAAVLFRICRVVNWIGMTCRWPTVWSGLFCGRGGVVDGPRVPPVAKLWKRRHSVALELLWMDRSALLVAQSQWRVANSEVLEAAVLCGLEGIVHGPVSLEVLPTPRWWKRLCCVASAALVLDHTVLPASQSQWTGIQLQSCGSSCTLWS